MFIIASVTRAQQTDFRNVWHDFYFGWHIEHIRRFFKRHPNHPLENLLDYGIFMENITYFGRKQIWWLVWRMCYVCYFFICFVVAVTDVAVAIINVVGSAVVATVAYTTIKMNAPMTAKDSRHVHIAPNYHTQHFALLVAVSIEMRIISYFRAKIAAARILRLSATSFQHVNQIRSLYNELSDRVPCHFFFI